MASYIDYLKQLQDNVAKSDADSRDKLIEELEKLEGEYQNRAESSSVLPDNPSYDRLEYDAPTDEEIAENARNSLADYKNTTIEDIEENARTERAAKEAERKSAQESAAKLSANIASQYDDAMTAFSDDALKRGLARSSIAANKSAELQSGKAAALSQAAMAAEEAVQNIDREISELEVSREKALNDFNIAYAAKVTEKIAELTKERDDKIAEVVKYNNSMAQQEQKDALDRAETASKLYSDKLNQEKLENELGSTAELDAYNLAKYEAVKSYLSTLSKSDASYAVRNDPVIRATLSDYYFYTLYNEYCK